MKQLTFHIAKLRHKRKLTAKSLANLSKVALRTIEDIEAGKVNPRLETMCKLADALEVPVTDLFSYE